MFIIIERDKFIEAIHKVVRFAQRNATLPVLSCVLIVVDDKNIKFRSTNLEVGIDLRVDGVIKSTGVVAIPANILQQIASALSKEETINLEQSGDTVVVSFGDTRNIIKTVPYEDFPIIPTPTTDKKYSLDGVLFKSAIESVLSCASASTIRPDLSSIFLTLEGGTLTTVATDSFRLAEKKQVFPTNIPNHSILIPAKNGSNIIQTIPNDAVTFIIDEHQITFLWDGSTLATRLTTGTYPDYRQIIPKKTTTQATLLRKDFESALRHTTIFSDAFQKIQLTFDQKKQHLIISSHNTDTGSAKESIHAKITGDTIEQSFNYRYLQTPISLLTTESITISASGVGQPLIIRGVGDNSFLYLVMPMNQ